jgi:hypothetical protein
MTDNFNDKTGQLVSKPQVTFNTAYSAMQNRQDHP